MQKEIYLTEAPFPPEANDNHLPKERTMPTLFALRPQVCQLSRKNLPALPHQSYYENKLLKPGMNMLKSVIELEEKRVNGQYSGPTLKVNITETVMLSDNSNCLLSTENGVVKMDGYVTNESFLTSLDLPKTKSCYPAVVSSSTSTSNYNFSHSILMSNQIAGNRIIPRSQGLVVSKFITPFADTPNLLRLYYCPPSCKRQKRNCGYKLLNNSVMNQEMFLKKHRQTHSYLVNPDKKATYSMNILKGKSLQTFEKMAQSLVQYLEKGYPVKITELVLDFVVDYRKEPWLLEVQGIRSTTLTKLWDVGTQKEIELLVEKNNNSQLCKLCRMTFSKQDIQKLVTNKLIWEIITHIRQRGIDVPSITHLRKQGFSNVCMVCYEIIVAEHRLIEVQGQFSDILNITPFGADGNEENVQDGKFKIWKEMDCQQNGVLKFPKMKGWRLFFYLEKVKYNDSLFPGKPAVVNLEVRLKDYKQKFTKQMVGEKQFNFFHSRFSKRAESAKVLKKKAYCRTPKQQNNGGKSGVSLSTMASKVTAGYSQVSMRHNIDIKKAKVLTFYTRQDQSNIFEEAEMQFTLHLDQDKFQGRSLTLQQFKSKDTCQRHSSEVFLFNKELKYCNLELTVGLISDGYRSVDDLALKQHNGIFYSDKLLRTYLPLPSEWMEVFTKGQYIPSLTRQVNYEEIKEEELLKRTKIEMEG